MAYVDASQLPNLPPPGVNAAAAQAAPAAATPPPETAAIPAPSPSQRAPSTPAVAGPTPTADAVKLHSSRDAEPTTESPLRYRERTYVVSEGTSPAAAEAMLRARLDDLQVGLANEPQGKFVNLAAFDHDWQGRPAKPPLVTLEWKDWRGEPQVAYPLEQMRAKAAAQPAAPARPVTPTPSPVRAPAAPVQVATPMKAPVQATAPKQPPRQRGRTATDEHDARLAQAFEACQDLLFLTSPAEALDFTTRLLLELVPSEAVSGCLYDINTDEFRFVSVHGPGSEQRQGEAVPANAGIMGIAAHAHTGPMRVADARQDGRYDPGVDGRVGVEILDLCYLPLEHHGRLLGMIQTINRQHGPGFTEKDVHLFNYVGKQTSEFLFRARIAPDKPKS